MDYLYYRDYSPPTLYPWYPWTIYIKGTTVLQPYIPDIPGLFILLGLQSSNPISLISLDYLYYRDYRPPTLYPWYTWTIYIKGTAVLQPYISDIPGLFILQGLQASNPISLISLDYLYYRDCSPPTLSLISLDYLYYRLDYLYYRDYSPPTLYLWYPWTIYITGTLVLQPYISDIPGLFILQGLQSSNPISLISLDYLYYRGCSHLTLYPWYPWTIYITGAAVI